MKGSLKNISNLESNKQIPSYEENKDKHNYNSNNILKSNENNDFDNLIIKKNGNFQ